MRHVLLRWVPLFSFVGLCVYHLGAGAELAFALIGAGFQTFVITALIWIVLAVIWPEKRSNEIRGRQLLTAVAIKAKLNLIMQKEDPGILWGTVRIPTSNATSHFAVVGAVGSGKTLTIRMLMQDQLTRIKPGSDRRAIIYDAKQDMMQIVGSMGLRCKVMLLNPFDERGYAWDMAKDVTSPLSARELAMTLIPDEKESQKFFNNAARELLTQLLMTFIKSRPGSWTFREVLLVMRSKELLRKVLGQDEENKEIIQNILECGPETLGSIMATIATKLGPYGAVAAAWERAGERKISVVEWLKSDSILILGNDERARSTLDIVNQLFVSLVATHALTMSESASRMTWLFFDEFREAGKLRGLENLILRGRSKGCCVVLGFQDIQGVQEVYGERLGNELVGQCGNKAILRLESPETAKWASQCVGEVEKWVASTSHSQKGGSSTSHSIQNVAQVMPAEFMQLPVPDKATQTGLHGVYLVRSAGCFHAHYRHDALSKLLGTVDKDISPFIPTPVEYQYLEPWSSSDDSKLIGHNGQHQQHAPPEPHHGIHQIKRLDF